MGSRPAHEPNPLGTFQPGHHIRSSDGHLLAGVHVHQAAVVLESVRRIAAVNQQVGRPADELKYLLLMALVQPPQIPLGIRQLRREQLNAPVVVHTNQRNARVA